MNYKTIGIMGGMGSLSTVDLFSKIVNNTSAKCDQEHLPVLIDNYPKVPDRTDSLLHNGESPLPYLIKSATRLKSCGADFLLLACNAVHNFIDEVSREVEIESINGLEETANEVSRLKYSKIAMLGTERFLRKVDFSTYYKNHDIDVIIPNTEEQCVINNVIYKGIKAGRDIDDVKILSALKRLYEEGAEVFVLSCTELPIAFDKYGIHHYLTIYSSLVMAKTAIKKAGVTLLHDA